MDVGRVDGCATDGKVTEKSTEDVEVAGEEADGENRLHTPENASDKAPSACITRNHPKQQKCSESWEAVVTALEADASPASGCNVDDGTRLKRLLGPGDLGCKTDTRDIVHRVRVHPQSDGNKHVGETNAHRRKLEPSPTVRAREQDSVIDGGRGWCNESK